jgi:hypothetical protein
LNDVPLLPRVSDAAIALELVIVVVGPAVVVIAAVVVLVALLAVVPAVAILTVELARVGATDKLRLNGIIVPAVVVFVGVIGEVDLVSSTVTVVFAVDGEDVGAVGAMLFHSCLFRVSANIFTMALKGTVLRDFLFMFFY